MLSKSSTLSKVAGAGFVLALFALVAGLTWYIVKSDQDQVARGVEIEPVTGFRAYSGADEATPERPPVVEREESREQLPEELRGVEFDEDQEVVVIEEHHEPVQAREQAERALKPGQAFPVKRETLTMADRQQMRYGTKEQHQLLRQFNERLDRGEKPKLKKMVLPRALQPSTPIFVRTTPGERELSPAVERP